MNNKNYLRCYTIRKEHTLCLIIKLNDDFRAQFSFVIYDKEDKVVDDLKWIFGNKRSIVFKKRKPPYSYSRYRNNNQIVENFNRKIRILDYEKMLGTL